MNVTSLNLVNPYIVGRPIYEPELFFGRRKLFRFIEDNLRQGVQVILLHGQRRIGKSSVLMQIPNFVGKDNFIFIYFDLHDKNNLPLSSILQNLAIAINQKLDQLGLSSFADEPFSLTSLEASLYESNYPKLFLNEFLLKVINILAQNNQKIVLLLDEFDVLNNQSSGSLTEQFFVYLQSLINQYSELFLIPVVGRRIEDLDNLKSLFKQAPNHEIGLLDTKIEAKDLILKPVANSLKYEDDAVTAILELTSGHAYLTQAVCYSLFLQAEEEEKSVITAADVKSIVDDAIELAEGGLAWFRDGLPISERVVFSAVAEAEKLAEQLLQKNLNKTMERLSYRSDFESKIVDAITNEYLDLLDLDLLDLSNKRLQEFFVEDFNHGKIENIELFKKRFAEYLKEKYTLHRYIDQLQRSSLVEPLKLLQEYGVIITEDLAKAPLNLLRWSFLERLDHKIFSGNNDSFKCKIKVKLVSYWLTKRYPLGQAIWELEKADVEAFELFELTTAISEKRKLHLTGLYETVIELNPNHFPALFKLAENYLEAGNFKKARDKYQRADKVDPGRAEEGYSLVRNQFALIILGWKNSVLSSPNTLPVILFLLSLFVIIIGGLALHHHNIFYN
jgi:hypothetical protein